jgi:glutamyl/glutaminyl-tRNA synthetase
VAAFEISGMGKSGAVLDPIKLDWMNAQYITRLTNEGLLARLSSYLEKYHGDFYTRVFVPAGSVKNLTIVSELRTRLKRLSEYPELTGFLYGDAALRPELLVNPKMKIETPEQAREFLQFGLGVLESLRTQGDLQDPESTKAVVMEMIAAAGHKNGQILWPLRIALSGEEFSPGAFECLTILGLDLSIARTRALLEKCA